MQRRRRGIGGAKLVRPELAPYGLRDAEAPRPVETVRAACPKVGSRQRVGLCQKPSKPGRQMRHNSDVCALLRETGLADRESLYALHLDAHNRVIGVEEVAKGTINQVQTSARELFKAAILNNAASIILSHNHPSGSPEPSQADIDMTREIAKAGRLLGIPLRDHVIVGSDGCESLRTRGVGADFGGARRRGRR